MSHVVFVCLVCVDLQWLKEQPQATAASPGGEVRLLHARLNTYVRSCVSSVIQVRCCRAVRSASLSFYMWTRALGLHWWMQQNGESAMLGAATPSELPPQAFARAI